MSVFFNRQHGQIRVTIVARTATNAVAEAEAEAEAEKQVNTQERRPAASYQSC